MDQKSSCETKIGKGKEQARNYEASGVFPVGALFEVDPGILCSEIDNE